MSGSVHGASARNDVGTQWRQVAGVSRGCRFGLIGDGYENGFRIL